MADQSQTATQAGDGSSIKDIQAKLLLAALESKDKDEKQALLDLLTEGKVPPQGSAAWATSNRILHTTPYENRPDLFASAANAYRQQQARQQPTQAISQATPVRSQGGTPAAAAQPPLPVVQHASATPPPTSAATAAIPQVVVNTPPVATVAGSRYDPAQASILVDPQGGGERQLRQDVILREMGFDPTKPTRMMARIAGMLSGTEKSPGALDYYTHLAGLGSGDGMDLDTAALAPQMVDFAKSFTAPGANPYAQIRGMANRALANPGTVEMVRGMGDGQGAQEDFLTFLLGARTYGANGLVRQSLADQAQRASANYGLASYDNPTGTGTFYEVVNADPGLRRLFGLG